MRLTGGDVVCEALLSEGIDVIFGLPGGAILPLYDALTRYPALRHILVRHEQGAAHAADGYARATGQTGVCFATSGPGATNLMTGLAAAYTDSVPLVAITANAPTHLLGRDSFQEVDTVNIARPITKASFLVKEIDDLAPTLAEAFYLARSGRPRPVLVDIPKDLLSGLAHFAYPVTTDRGTPAAPDRESLTLAAALISNVERPVVVAGHGVILANAYAELREFVEKAHLPVANTLLGLSSIPLSHPLSLGMMGMHGLPHANLAIQEADLIIGLGARFDDRACSRFEDFAPQARLIQVEVDEREFGRNVRADVSVLGDVKTVLASLTGLVPRLCHDWWLDHLNGVRQERPLVVADGGELAPQQIIRDLAAVTGREAVVVTDVGQHQMWTAQHFGFEKPNSLVTSGGLGTMGFGVPAAIGVKVGLPQQRVWAVVGDGGFQMTSQELAVMAAEGLDVKILIMNNRRLGMVRQWQELIYERRYSAVAPSQPDFVRLAEAYGLKAWRVSEREQAEPALRAAIEHPGPALVDCWVSAEENCFPMVKAGAPLHDMLEDDRRLALRI